MPPTPAATAAGYRNLWHKAELRPDKRDDAIKLARRILSNRARYQAVARITGVPWPMIGVLHNRESGLSFAGVLHNGETIIGTGRRTGLVPAGRGPFSSWENAAIDALTMPGHRLHQVASWSLERILYECEKYNGWGYLGKGNSPYLWSWTSLYIGGKYVADHQYSASAWDQQAGCAALFKALCEIDAECAKLFAQAPAETRPPADVKREATQKQRAVRNAGGVTAAGGASGAAAKQAGTVQSDGAAFLHPVLTWTAIGVGIAAVIVAGVLIARRRRLIEQAWTGIEQRVPLLERAATSAWKKVIAVFGKKER